MQASPPLPKAFAVRDVCLGFCYDPVAALGFSVLQQRRRLLSRSAAGSALWVAECEKRKAESR